MIEDIMPQAQSTGRRKKMLVPAVRRVRVRGAAAPAQPARKVREAVVANRARWVRGAVRVPRVRRALVAVGDQTVRKVNLGQPVLKG